MILFDLLNENDKEKISSYIEAFACTQNMDDTRKASLREVLKYWNSSKETLYKLLGNQFIISKKVQFIQSEDHLMYDFVNLYETNPTFCALRDDICNILYPLNPRNYALNLFDCRTLAINKVDRSFHIDLPNNETLFVQSGSKPIKIIGKLAKACGVDGFEEFRLEHSRVHNQKKLSGELCLSIHPLDFMTMSDNANDWSSCMSWIEDGGYRRGTIEMMNSPMVIVAYLKSDKDFYFLNGQAWNSKKWRSLFIVTSDIITSVKNYPYENNSLTDEVLKWLAELAKTNLHHNFDDTIYCYNHEESFKLKNKCELILSFETNTMYNDFEYDHRCMVSEHILNSNTVTYISENYSGEENCMWCGECDAFCDDEENALVCNICDKTPICTICESHIHGDVCYVDDDPYCYYCFEDNFTIDPITNEQMPLQEMDEISLSRHKTKEKASIPFYYEMSILVTSDVWKDHADTWATYFKKSPVKVTNVYGREHLYISPKNCTEKGLALFGIHSDKDLQEYLKQNDNDWCW